MSSCLEFCYLLRVQQEELHVGASVDTKVLQEMNGADAEVLLHLLHGFISQ